MSKPVPPVSVKAKRRGSESSSESDGESTMPMLVSRAALVGGKLSKVQAYLVPLAGTLNQFNDWLTLHLRGLGPGDKQKIRLSGDFNADEGVDEDLVQEVHDRISFGNIPSGYWAMLRGTCDADGLWVELYRER